MSDINNIFFELIRLSIGTQSSLSHQPTEKEWKRLYDMALKQSLVGICFAGVRKLCDSDAEYYHGMTEMQYLVWMGMAAKIQQRNQKMDAYTQKTLEHFRKEGFACTVLKGQGIGQLYGSLKELRQSGDVDVWVSGGRKKLYDHSMRIFGRLEGLTYHHIHFPIFKECEVEAHVWPSFFPSPFANNCFHKFCQLYEPKLGSSDTPSLAFNRVFILQHCYGHFCGHGVGLRQLIDYYFVLMQGFTEEERKEAMYWIDILDMKRFTAALMWLCNVVFHMPKDKCLCEPNEKDGCFLLEEVMRSGNMGHQDERVNSRNLQSALGRYMYNIKRDRLTMRIAPHYAFWEPLWGVFQFVWVRITNLRHNR